MWRNERKKTDSGMKRLILAAVMLVLVCVGVNRSAAAEGNLLNRDSAMVYVGDHVALADYVYEEFKDGFDFEWVATPDESVAVLTKDGIVKTKGKGEVQILISYLDEEGDTQSETLYLSIVEPESLSLEYGSSMYLEAVEMYQDVAVLEYTSDADSVLVSATGKLTAQGFKKATITATKEDGVSFTVAEVSIIEPKLQKETVIRAVGTEDYEIQLDYFSVTDEDESIVWKVADESIAVMGEKGLNALKKGSTTAVITLTAKNGETKELECKIIVTDPKLSETKIIMAAGTTKNITISGADASSEVIWEDGNNVAYFSEAGKIYAESKGTATLKITVDGKTLTCTVQVSNPEYADLTIILYKGQSKNLKLKGLVSGSKVTYTSGKKSIVTISSKGKMKAKKTGHATIKVNADGKQMNILAEISTKKGYQASKKAIAISKTKTKYSQARRMSKGYYDCSSLVSRVYRQYGVSLGSPRGWSPTAAAIGKWCVNNKKVVARKGVSYKKLLPGDLIFFSYKKNGRYKNITHVEIYTGGASDVSASSSNNRVIHYGYSNSSSIVLIARPTK